MNDYKLLLDEAPMLIIRELAFAVGLPQAIILQQVHYWVKTNEFARRNFKDGYYWTYNTYEEWQSQFFFWSLATVKRYFKGLEKDKFIISGNFNRLAIDRTKWYRVNYEAIAESVKLTHSDFARLMSKRSKLANGEFNLTRPLPEINTENTTENSELNKMFTEALEDLKNQVNGANFRTWLQDMVPIAFDGEVFTVGVKNTFTLEYLDKNQRSLIENVLTKVAGNEVVLNLVVAPAKEGMKK